MFSLQTRLIRQAYPEPYDATRHLEPVVVRDLDLVAAREFILRGAARAERHLLVFALLCLPKRLALRRFKGRLPSLDVLLGRHHAHFQVGIGRWKQVEVEVLLGEERLWDLQHGDHQFTRALLKHARHFAEARKHAPHIFHLES